MLPCSIYFVFQDASETNNEIAEHQNESVGSEDSLNSEDDSEGDNSLEAVAEVPPEEAQEQEYLGPFTYFCHKCNRSVEHPQLKHYLNFVHVFDFSAKIEVSFFDEAIRDLFEMATEELFAKKPLTPGQVEDDQEIVRLFNGQKFRSVTLGMRGRRDERSKNGVSFTVQYIQPLDWHQYAEFLLEKGGLGENTDD